MCIVFNNKKQQKEWDTTNYFGFVFCMAYERNQCQADCSRSKRPSSATNKSKFHPNSNNNNQTASTFDAKNEFIRVFQEADHSRATQNVSGLLRTTSVRRNKSGVRAKQSSEEEKKKAHTRAQFSLLWSIFRRQTTA